MEYSIIEIIFISVINKFDSVVVVIIAIAVVVSDTYLLLNNKTSEATEPLYYEPVS